MKTCTGGNGDLKTKQPLMKRRSKPSVPKLSVLSVLEDGQVECQLEITRQKTVTFGFNHNEMTAAEVADKLVSIVYKESFKGEEIFLSMVFYFF